LAARDRQRWHPNHNFRSIVELQPALMAIQIGWPAGSIPRPPTTGRPETTEPPQSKALPDYEQLDYSQFRSYVVPRVSYTALVQGPLRTSI
jgi:hypothetical protein